MAHVPKYRRHSTRNKGFVEYRKKRIYFSGEFNSAESLREYSDFIKALEETDTAGHTFADLATIRNQDIPVNYLVGRFLDDAKNRFVKNGRSTGTYEKYCLHSEPLTEMYGDMPVSEFGPLALKSVRDRYVKIGLCRREANDRTATLCRIFAWGVENELVPASVADALKYVRGLRAGETVAKESAPVRPVSIETVIATIPHLPPTVDDMVRLQWLTGARPGEVRNLRWIDIDQTDPDVWIFVPWEHKTEHHKKERLVAITPPGQEVLKKYRHRPVEEFIFSPRETVLLLAEQKRAARKTKVQPSQIERNEQRARKPKTKFNEQYTRSAYEHAIKRACRKAGIEEWSPNQLRHSFSTNAREQLGAEASQVMLGHAHLSTTEIYAEKTRRLLKEKAMQFKLKSIDDEIEERKKKEAR